MMILKNSKFFQNYGLNSSNFKNIKYNLVINLLEIKNFMLNFYLLKIIFYSNRKNNK
jgi:hypothetical protein